MLSQTKLDLWLPFLKDSIQSVSLSLSVVFSCTALPHANCSNHASFALPWTHQEHPSLKTSATAFPSVWYDLLQDLHVSYFMKRIWKLSGDLRPLKTWFICSTKYRCKFVSYLQWKCWLKFWTQLRLSRGDIRETSDTLMTGERKKIEIEKKLPPRYAFILSPMYHYHGNF